MPTFSRPFLLILLAAGLSLLLSGWTLRLNVGSPSAPRGLYVRSFAEPRIGDWVIACLPPDVEAFGNARSYLGWKGAFSSCPTTDLLKKVGGLPGSMIRVGEGSHLTPLGHLPIASYDSRGRPMPRLLPQTYRVPQGTVWLTSDHIPHSWDSRYFGPVGQASIAGVWRPLIAW